MNHSNNDIENAKNLGPVSGSEMKSVGINTVSELKSLGWEEAFVRVTELYPERLNLNFATSLIGAIEGQDWREVDSSQKEAARTLIRKLKQKHLSQVS